MSKLPPDALQRLRKIDADRRQAAIARGESRSIQIGRAGRKLALEIAGKGKLPDAELDRECGKLARENLPASTEPGKPGTPIKAPSTPASKAPASTLPPSAVSTPSAKPGAVSGKPATMAPATVSTQLRGRDALAENFRKQLENPQARAGIPHPPHSVKTTEPPPLRGAELLRAHFEKSLAEQGKK